MEKILLKPIPMSREIMIDLENRGLIIRLAPGSHDLQPVDGSTACSLIYDPLDNFGPHKLMIVTVNRFDLPEFGIHPDNEDFFLIGDPSSKPLYLVIGLCLQEVLEEKIRDNTVSSNDFITLKVKFNDPDVSFFTMLKNVPHGEAIGIGQGPLPSFYVAESRDMIDVDTQMGNYRLIIEE